MRRVLAACSIALALGSAAPVHAQTEDPVDWRWRRFQAWEYAATAVALGSAFVLRFGTSQPDADWKGGILFDDSIRERATLDDRKNRRFVDGMTDTLFFGAMGYRFIDSALVPSIGWGNADTALQMSMIDLEAFGLVAITLWGGQKLFGRQRPWVDRCADPELQEELDCGAESTDKNRSFYAGHPAVGMTAAGLTCVHHSHLPLYGGGAADTLACGLTVGAAFVNGFGRVVTEKHYATDLVVGFGIGAFAGFVLPELLHYDHPSSRPSATARRRRALEVRASVMPMVSDDRAGMALLGVF